MRQNGDRTEVEFTIWLAEENAELLDAYAAATGRTPEEVVTELLLARLEEERTQDGE